MDAGLLKTKVSENFPEKFFTGVAGIRNEKLPESGTGIRCAFAGGLSQGLFVDADQFIEEFHKCLKGVQFFHRPGLLLAVVCGIA